MNGASRLDDRVDDVRANQLLTRRRNRAGRPTHSHYEPSKRLRDQLGQHFGHRSALGFYAYRAKEGGRPASLDDILTDGSLEHLEWFRSAKTRAAEAFFLERLLKRARELLPR